MACGLCMQPMHGAISPRQSHSEMASRCNTSTAAAVHVYVKHKADSLTPFKVKQTSTHLSTSHDAHTQRDKFSPAAATAAEVAVSAAATWQQRLCQHHQHCRHCRALLQLLLQLPPPQPQLLVLKIC